MSIDVLMTRTYAGLVPHDEDAAAMLERIPLGRPVGITLTEVRKGEFHRRLFSLLSWAYQNTEHPPVEYRGMEVRQSFKSFRDGLVIKAGYHEMDVNNRGDVMLRAKSLSYAETTQDEIEAIYSDILDVIAETLFAGEYTPEQLRALDDEFRRYSFRRAA